MFGGKVMIIWTETSKNYWKDNNEKYGLKLHSRGNWWISVEDLATGRVISRVYLALPNEEQARGYMLNLLYIPQSADELVTSLKKISR